jgi:hypothetical protein
MRSTGWRAHFDDDFPEPETEPQTPRLRLVPRSGPMTARHDEHRTAA